MRYLTDAVKGSCKKSKAPPNSSLTPYSYCTLVIPLMSSYFLRSFLLTSETKLPFESRLKLRFFALL